MCSLKRCCFYQLRRIVIPTKRIRVKASKYCFLSPPPFPGIDVFPFLYRTTIVLLRPYINTVVCMFEIKRVFYSLLCKIEESLIFSVQNVTGYACFTRLSNKSRHLDMKHDIDIANTSQGRTIQRRCFV